MKDTVAGGICATQGTFSSIEIYVVVRAVIMR